MPLYSEYNAGQFLFDPSNRGLIPDPIQRMLSMDRRTQLEHLARLGAEPEEQENVGRLEVSILGAMLILHGASLDTKVTTMQTGEEITLLDVASGEIDFSLPEEKCTALRDDPGTLFAEFRVRAARRRASLDSGEAWLVFRAILLVQFERISGNSVRESFVALVGAEGWRWDTTGLHMTKTAGVALAAALSASYSLFKSFFVVSESPVLYGWHKEDDGVEHIHAAGSSFQISFWEEGSAVQS
jgi:hypothetical protein